MKKVWIIAVLVLVVTALFTVAHGCGGASAPPVSLPTPVTGRIVVSSPDAEGMISVIGEENSVDAGSTVMAINTNQVALFRYDRIINFVVGNVYAVTNSSFPAVCSETGHTCALADSSGAFSLTIYGEEGDQIIIVLIDASTGAELSDRITRDVPTGYIHSSTGPVDLAKNPNKEELFVLMKGGEVSGSTLPNRVQALDLSTGQLGTDYVEAGGVDATLLAADSIGVAVVDAGSSEKNLYVSAYDGSGNIAGFSKVSLAYGSGYINPSDMHFSSCVDELMIANRDAAVGLFLYNYSSSAQNTLTPDFSTLGQSVSHLGTDALAVGSYNNTGNIYSLVALASRYSIDGTTYAILGIYNEQDISSWLTVGGNPPDVWGYILLPYNDASIADITFVSDIGTLLLADSTNNIVYVYDLTEQGGMLQISLEETVEFDDFSSPQRMLVEDVSTSAYSGYVGFVTLENGDENSLDKILTVKEDYSSGAGSIVISYQYTQVGLSPNRLYYDASREYLYVSCSTSQNVTKISLSELLP